MSKLASVLLVDDDSTTNYLNQLLFSRLNLAARLFVAENGREALDTLAQKCLAPNADCPTLVLLDLNMRVMNGIEFLEAYQQLPLTQRQAIVIVLLTTSASPRDLARVHALPVAGTLTKPLTESKLTGLLQQHFPGLQAS